MMNYRLSIIIPHYNNIELLMKLLISIPDKDDIQVIVVDDHSPDDAKEEYFQLRDEFDPDRYLFLENLSEVHNAGAARNIGLNYVEGEWLLFADSDDHFLEGFYDSVSQYFDQEYDLIYFKSTSIYLDTGEQGKRHISYNDRLNAYLSNPTHKNEIILRTRWDVPFAKLIRTELVKENDIQFEEVPVGNDKLFSTKLGFYAKSIAACEETIYCITRNKGSLTTRQDFASFEVRAHTEIRQNDFWKKHYSRKDYAYIGRFSAYEDLYLILKRRYGIKIFFKYLKIFSQNHMLFIHIRSLRAGLFSTFRRAMGEENKIKQNYVQPVR